MKLNLAFKVKDLNGKAFGEDTAGRILAASLANSNTGNAAQLYDLSKKLWSDKAVDITAAEATELKTFIEKTQVMTNLTKGQLLEAISKAALSDK